MRFQKTDFQNTKNKNEKTRIEKTNFKNGQKEMEKMSATQQITQDKFSKIDDDRGGGNSCITLGLSKNS